MAKVPEHSDRIDNHETSIDSETHSNSKSVSNGTHGKTHGFAMQHLESEGHSMAQEPDADDRA